MSKPAAKRPKQDQDEDNALYNDWDKSLNFSVVVAPSVDQIQSAAIVESDYLEYVRDVKQRLASQSADDIDIEEGTAVQEVMESVMEAQKNLPELTLPSNSAGPTFRPGASGQNSLDPRAQLDPLPQNQIQVAANVFRQAQTAGNSVAALPHAHRTFARAYNVETLPVTAPITVLPTQSKSATITAKNVPSTIPTNKIPIVLPSCSAWFDQNSIHAIEREQLASIFFSSSRRPLSVFGLGGEEREQKYKLVRNQIVALYRREPSRRLVFSDVRRMIDTDVALLARVFAFVEHWGIINFQAQGASTTTLRSVESIINPPLSSSLPNEDTTGANNNNVNNNMGVMGKTTKGPFSCASCSKICVYAYYVLRGATGPRHGVSLTLLHKSAWCIACFSRGLFPPNLNASNFVRVDVPAACTESQLWSEEETMRLFEGIERFAEDWVAVAAFVGGGKTPAQCVERFIAFPIAEPLMAPVSQKLGGEGGLPLKMQSMADWAALVGSSREKKVPLLETANPVETLLAMLASTVHPTVAGAAAKAALEEAMHQHAVKKADQKGEGALAKLEREGQAGGEDSVVEQVQSNEGNSATDVDLALDMEAMCATALGAAVAKTHDLSIKEKHEAAGLIPTLLDLKMQKMELRILQLQNLETLLSNEAAALACKLASVRGEDKDMST